VARPLLPLLAALCLLACTNSGQPAAAASPSPTATVPPASPAITIRPPADVILADADVGLPRVATRDDVSLPQAASEQQNQPLALTQYRAWGWIVESVRTWGGGSQRVDENLVLLTRVEGASLAFQGWAGELAQRGGCPDGLGLDQCAVGSGVLVGRVDRYVFRLSGSGIDLSKLGGVQTTRILRP
jgi:hypothetical protein